MVQKNILLEIQKHIEIAQSKIAVDAANEFISKNKSILENETSIESGFSATSFKTSAYWFWENKRQIISDTGIPYHYGYLTQKSTWKWDDMKFKGKLIKIKSSSSADSYYTGGTLTFLDVDKKF
ncbi:MAG: hypothetical protein IPQ05_15540 [Leptospiraceae bacterium]|nr:hypothetical protein [Leptospiraceae bacterium]